MDRFARDTLAALLVGTSLCLAASAAFAADEAAAQPKGAAVTVLKAAKSCFGNIVEVSGIVIPREETQVRPERMGLKVAEVLVEAGDGVTAGQTLARLTLPEGGTALVQAPVAGLISASTAAVGATASGKGEALFSIIARSEFDLVGLVPTRNCEQWDFGIHPGRARRPSKIARLGESYGRTADHFQCPPSLFSPTTVPGRTPHRAVDHARHCGKYLDIRSGKRHIRAIVVFWGRSHRCVVAQWETGCI